jgi:hypothetical protein
VGKVRLTDCDFVFWDREEVSDIFTLGYLGNDFEYDTDELRVLFKKLASLSWFTD